MDKKMKFKYFYGAEADQFSFYRIPKALFTDSYFKDLSSDAKILYGLMLDRMSLSIKNQWFDEKNRAYIYFSIEDIMEIIYVFLTIFLYLLKCPQSLILSALRAFCFCGKPHISRSIFLYFRYQSWLKSW